jgi:polysaccharide export outer membrane protein
MRAAIYALSALIIVFMLATPIVTAQTQPVRPPLLDKDYVIGPEDVLDIQVWGSKDLNQTVLRPDGRVSLPLVGEIAVGGKTVQQLQDHLTEVYEKTVKGAVVAIIVKEIRSRPIYFIGGFAAPGAVQLTRQLTLLQALSVVGGVMPNADGEKGFLLRGNNKIPIDFTRLVQRGDLSQNPKLEPGDSVVVPLADVVYVSGEVMRPGAVKYTGDLTVLKAITQAGGLWFGGYPQGKRREERADPRRSWPDHAVAGREFRCPVATERHPLGSAALLHHRRPVRRRIHARVRNDTSTRRPTPPLRTLRVQARRSSR